LNWDFAVWKDVSPSCFAFSIQVSPRSVFSQTRASLAGVLGLNLSQASADAMRVIDFLPCIVGSEQRPHQKTQSMHWKTLLEKSESFLPKLNLWLFLKKKKEGEKQDKFVLGEAGPVGFEPTISGSEGRHLNPC
jgi:hypothetical protein